MTQDLLEAKPIARLIAEDGATVIGRVYCWNTGELGILWTADDRNPKYIDQQIEWAVVAKAEAKANVEVLAFLECLEPL